MDLKKMKSILQDGLKKENLIKIVFLLGICGIALIYLSTWFGSGDEKPGKAAETGESFPDQYEKKLEEDLLRIVKAITGEDSPAVMVTLENSGRYVYASDEKRNTQSDTEGENSREESETVHILLKDADGSQRALTVTEIKPKVKGVVIVSRYAGDAVIREKLTEAVRVALDVSSAKVCVTDSG